MVAVSAIGLSVSIGTVVVYSFAVFLKPLTQEFHWSRSEVSVAISLTNLMVTLGSPAAGRLVDRVGGRAVILPSVLLLGAVLVAFYFLGGHLWQLYLLYSLAGVVGLGATSLTYSRVVASWFDARRGVALGLSTSGIGVGAFILPSLAQWLIGLAGWRFAYVALGVIAVLIPFPLVALFLRDAPSAAGIQPADRARNHRSPVRELPELTRSEALRTRIFWQMLILFFLVSTCVNGTVVHLSALLTDRGSAPQAAALAISLFGGAAVVGRIVTGYLVDRFFAPYVIAVLFSGTATALALLAAGSTGMLASLAAMLMGLGLGAEADVMPYLISRYFGLRALGELFGYVFGFYTLGVVVGPLLMGAGFDITGSYRVPLTGFTIAVIAAAAGTLAFPGYARVGSNAHRAGPST